MKISAHLKYIGSLFGESSALGLSSADMLKYAASGYGAKLNIGGQIWSVHVNGFTIPIRANGVDRRILSEVFGNIYQVETAGLPVTRILDLGGNAGYSAAYFHGQFPGASIACVEPSPKNAALLERTVSLNNLPVRVFQAAIGVTGGEAAFWETGDPSCCTLIEDARASEAAKITVPQLTVRSVMDQMNWDGIDLVKIDIEGYERILLKSNCEWLAKTAILTGEIHEGYSLADLEADLHPYGFQVTERARNREYGMVNFTASRS